MTTNANAPVETRHIAAAGKVHTAAVRDELAQALANLEAARAENADLTNRLAKMAALIRFAHDTLMEINPSNYDHDDVCKMNAASVEVILALAPMLGETHGKTPEWWANFASGHTPSPCPSCAAKDEAMAEMRATITEAMDLGVTEEAWDVLKPYRIPPADPVADELRSLIAEHNVDIGQAGFDAMLAWHKGELSRLPLGGAK